MTDKAKPADSRYFHKGGKAGNAPGLGSRNLSGTSPDHSVRPAKGWGQSKFRTHPKKPPGKPGQ